MVYNRGIQQILCAFGAKSLRVLAQQKKILLKEIGVNKMIEYLDILFDDDIIRLISAREANRQESKKYMGGK